MCEKFTQAYGPDGVWAQWFSRARGYLGTGLIQDEISSYRFRALDYFTGKLARDDYVSAHENEYLKLDTFWEKATLSERNID